MRDVLRNRDLEPERRGPLRVDPLADMSAHRAERAVVRVVDQVGERALRMAVDDERRVARIAEIVDAAGDLRQRDALVVCAVDVEAQLVLREFEYAVDPVERRPDARRAVRELARRVRRRFEAAAGERRDDVEHAGVRLVFEREFLERATGDDRRALGHLAVLQRVAEIIAQVFGHPGRQVARDARHRRAGEIGAQVERAAAVAGVRVRARHRDFGIGVRHEQVGQRDVDACVFLAGRGRDRPFRIAAQPVERQARLVEFTGHRDGRVDRVEMRGAARLVRVDAAPQVFDTRPAGARVAARREPGRRFLRGEADALEIAEEAVAHDRRGAHAPLLVGEVRVRGFRALDLDVIVRHHSARVDLDQFVAQACRQRQPADEFAEDAEIDAVADDAQQLPLVRGRHAVAGRQRRQRERAGKRRAVRQRRLAELRVEACQVQRVVVAGVELHVPAEAHRRHVEPRLRRAHAQRDVRALQVAARRMQVAVAEGGPDRVVDPARMDRERHVEVARQRLQVDRARRQVRVARPVRRLADRREWLVLEACAEVERAEQQRAVRGRLQRGLVYAAVVEHREPDARQHELRRVMLRVAPAQRAAAQHDRFLFQQPRAERVVAAVGGRHTDARDAQRAVGRPRDDQVGLVDDQARQRGRQPQQRQPRQRGRRMRHRQRDLAVMAADRQVREFDARLHAGPVRGKLAD